VRRPRFLLILLGLFAGAVVGAEVERWKTAQEGFTFSIPWDWEKRQPRPTETRRNDARTGEYRGPTAHLEFEEIARGGPSAAEVDDAILLLQQKRASAARRERGESILVIDGRLASFVVRPVDPAVHGIRDFSKVAILVVPYATPPGFLEMRLFFSDDFQLADIHRIFASLLWPKPPLKAQPSPSSAG
jgi:hypothetical protein